jgi:dipeptidyl aminopeptidase/acylaminoacyl peptidase
VRFIRHQAGRFGIDPQRIGIVGASSGGQLSLLAAAAPPSADPGARDPVDRESSAVQAVVAYFPGVDNLNFGRANATILDHFLSQQYKAEAMFDFRRWDDTTNRYERVSDPEARREAFRRTSPLAHVSAATPPVLLFHGDQDRLVPIQQSRLLAARLQELGVPHRLVVAEGKGHGWKPPLDSETTEVTEWFGKYLLGAKR